LPKRTTFTNQIKPLQNTNLKEEPFFPFKTEYHELIWERNGLILDGQENISLETSLL
jgi:hypothetical protein